MVDGCYCPGCGTTTDDATLYEEPLRHGDGTMLVCGKHADFTKDGIRVHDGPNKAAVAANAAVLAGAKARSD